MQLNYVKPGIHQNFNLSKFSENEKRVLMNLSKSFYLTYTGEKLTIGNGTYSYFLMKPTTQFSEMFNLEREILCVFSVYTNFEPRSIDVFEHIHKNLPKLRAESICSILISGDDEIDIKVESLLEADPEYPIIVPFTYKELFLSKNQDGISDKFRKLFYTRDLFSFQSPLKKDIYFFGRNNLVNEIVNRHKSNEHNSLFGLRKSGKTSIVYAVQRSLKLNNLEYVSIDCETPAIHIKKWNELLEKIVKTYHDTKESKIKIEYKDRYLENNAAESFEEDILKIYLSKKKVSTLFIFDEIERITPGTASSLHWNEKNDFIYFWQTLRAFYQKHPHIYTYMLVGTNPSSVETSKFLTLDNPIYLSMPNNFVPSFNLPQVKEMVTNLGSMMGLNFDDYICSKLFEDFGGHPFLIRQMCSLLNKSASNLRPILIDKTSYIKEYKEFFISHFAFFDMMLDVLKECYPDEYEMITYLANEDIELFEEFALENKNYISHLINYGLVQKGENGYCFNLEILSNHLKNIHKNKKINMTNEDKLDEISRRRNKIESKLRLSIKMSLKTSLGVKKAKEQVLASIPQDRREKYINFDLNEILHKYKSPLFLLDIINIINKNWNELSNTYEIEKDKFIMMLKEINTIGRPEAHAKEISNEDFTELRIYFNKIEPVLLDWDI